VRPTRRRDALQSMRLGANGSEHPSSPLLPGAVRLNRERFDPYQAPRKKKQKAEPFDYYARLIKRMPKPISAEASRAMDADRHDR
jgi:hypothetical protein